MESLLTNCKFTAVGNHAYPKHFTPGGQVCIVVDVNQRKAVRGGNHLLKRHQLLQLQFIVKYTFKL